jgi:putative ABC transport system permease protein
MRASNVLGLYVIRLRARWPAEALAVAGVAAGVALLFASLVAGSSLESSVADLSRGIVGRAQLQLLARSPQGMSERDVRAVREIAGVVAAAPLLEADAQARGPKGSESVELVGADESLAGLGGRLLRHTTLEPFAGVGAIVMPAPLAGRLGVRRFGAEVTFQLYGRSVKAPLYEQLGRKQIGSLVDSPIAIAPLFLAQEMAGLQGRVSRILVQTAPGSEAGVRAALTRLAAGRLDVRSTDYDERLFAKAATATSQSADLFAVIGALVGFLFAFNATLLTVPQRRRLIAELRHEGYPPETALRVMLLDAILLGLAACACGLALGQELSIHVLHGTPGYLSSAFTVGTQRVVSWQSVVLSIAGGMLAAAAAVLSPLRDAFSRDPLAGAATRRAGGEGAMAALALAALCVAGASAILLAAPAQAVLGMALLAVGLLLALPAVLGTVLALLGRIARLFASATPHVAAMELAATRTRATAIAATGAVAVFGGVAIQGAHGDLLRGLDEAAREMNAATDIWVAPPGSYNLLQVAPFPPREGASLARLPGVGAVRTYRGGLLDVGDRRVWVIAPPAGAQPLVPPSQLLQGSASHASALLRAGGWAVLSRQLASALGVGVGGRFVLPSPVPTPLRVAAISTNVGWAPGALMMSATQFERAWGSAAASALEVLVRPGASVARVEGETRRALGPHSGLAVQSAAAHRDRQRALSRQGLERLTQITTLMIVAAVLALAAAMGTMVWQRRPRLARLKLEGFSQAELWRTTALESVVLLGTGCASGAAFGLYGQRLLDKALANVVNFPLGYDLALPAALAIAGVVLSVAVLVLLLPGYLSARVAPVVGLTD